MRLEFIQSSYNTIRVWMIDDYGIDIIRNRKEFILFELLSIWGGYDKVNNDKNEWVHSWEIPLSLKDYIIDEFSHYPDCIIDI